LLDVFIILAERVCAYFFFDEFEIISLLKRAGGMDGDRRPLSVVRRFEQVVAGQHKERLLLSTLVATQVPELNDTPSGLSSREALTIYEGVCVNSCAGQHFHRDLRHHTPTFPKLQRISPVEALYDMPDLL